MRSYVNLEDALCTLGDEGFMIYQHQNEDTGEMWVDVCQVLRSIHSQQVPHFLTALGVAARKNGDLVVDRDDLRAILCQPAELPGDYVPDPRIAIPHPPVDVHEELSAFAEDDDGELDDDCDDDCDDDPDYTAEFSRMAE
jgi:hypothetical protein